MKTTYSGDPSTIANPPTIRQNKISWAQHVEIAINFTEHIHYAPEVEFFLFLFFLLCQEECSNVHNTYSQDVQAIRMSSDPAHVLI